MIKGKLNKILLDHNTGLGMIKLLDEANNAINMVKTNQMISAASVINNAIKEAITAKQQLVRRTRIIMKPNQQSQHGRKPSVKQNGRTSPTKQS